MSQATGSSSQTDSINAQVYNSGIDNAYAYMRKLNICGKLLWFVCYSSYGRTYVAGTTVNNITLDRLRPNGQQNEYEVVDYTGEFKGEKRGQLHFLRVVQVKF